MKWSSRAELNRRPHPYQGCALPLSYWSTFHNQQCGFPTKLERVAGIEPASSAWKAEVIAIIPYPHKHITKLNGGEGWIRTTEARASDLQSDPFGHSGTSPYLFNFLRDRNSSCATCWCRHQESNSGPTDYKSVALPTELCRLRHRVRRRKYYSRPQGVATPWQSFFSLFIAGYFCTSKAAQSELIKLSSSL